MINIERNQRFLLKNGGVTHLCSVEHCVVHSCLLFGISHCLLEREKARERIPSGFPENPQLRTVVTHIKGVIVNIVIYQNDQHEMIFDLITIKGGRKFEFTCTLRLFVPALQKYPSF